MAQCIDVVVGWMCIKNHCSQPYRGRSERTEDIDEVRGFGATLEEFLALNNWLKGAYCTYVAMRSTLVYWKPVYNILEWKVFGIRPRHRTNQNH